MHKKLTLTWKKITGIILGFLGIGTLVSCYGMMYPIDDNAICGDVYGDLNGDGIIEKTEGVKDIKITDVENNISEQTFYNGHFEILLRKKTGKYVLTFTDEDGEENGSFKDKTVDVELKESDYGYKYIEVYLEKK